MPKRKVQQPPFHPSPGAKSAPELYLLDRFSEQNIETWANRSQDLDELVRRLYFDTEPARIKFRLEISQALNKKTSAPVLFDQWVRVLGYRWCEDPLSSAGSIQTYGGRFNIGQDVEHSISPPFPAFYVAEDYETAYREYFQKEAGSTTGGLIPEELSLAGSVTIIRLRGRVERVLDLTDPVVLINATTVLKKIKMPKSVEEVLRRLRVPRGQRPRMVQTSADLQRIFTENWKEWPVVYGIPASSQVFGQFAVAAGFEAIRYRSTKQPSKNCLAIFPCNLASNRSFVELVDEPPPGVTLRRLDITTSEALSGLKGIRVKLPR